MIAFLALLHRLLCFLILDFVHHLAVVASLLADEEKEYSQVSSCLRIGVPEHKL